MGIGSVPSTITVNSDNYLLEGILSTKWVQSGVSAKMAVKGIFADAGTAIVQLDVSSGTNADFRLLNDTEPADSAISLVDSDGRKYSPIGFIIGDDKLMQLTLTPSDPPSSLSDLPLHQLSSSRSKTFKLIFQVTEGKTIKEFQVGDITVGTCNIKATRGRR
jgi:hypothetical protein